MDEHLRHLRVSNRESGRQGQNAVTKILFAAPAEGLHAAYVGDVITPMIQKPQ